MYAEDHLPSYLGYWYNFESNTSGYNLGLAGNSYRDWSASYRLIRAKSGVFWHRVTTLSRCDNYVKQFNMTEFPVRMVDQYSIGTNLVIPVVNRISGLTSFPGGRAKWNFERMLAMFNIIEVIAKCTPITHIEMRNMISEERMERCLPGHVRRPNPKANVLGSGWQPWYERLLVSSTAMNRSGEKVNGSG